MGFLQGVFSGIGAYGRALSLLFSRRFWWFLLFPAAMSVLLFFAGSYLVEGWGDLLAERVGARVDAWIREIAWLGWAGGATRLATRWLLRLVYFFSFVLWGGYLLLAALSPVFSWLSERVEAHLSGRIYPFRFGRFLWEVGRGILVAARNMALQMVVFAALFVLSFFPLGWLLTPPLALLASSYFYGFTFMDYAVERKRLNIRQGIGYIRGEGGRAVGIGLVFSLSLLFPAWRLPLCGIMSLLAVVAAAITLDDASKRNKNKV
ncbi:MAG: EI24 domain-containing protein [Odoribacteraceae bacterium]|nr:EI24 domain-containing protein [Odoribacteraceae bacterium]